MAAPMLGASAAAAVSGGVEHAVDGGVPVRPPVIGHQRRPGQREHPADRAGQHCSGDQQQRGAGQQAEQQRDRRGRGDDRHGPAADPEPGGQRPVAQPPGDLTGTAEPERPRRQPRRQAPALQQRDQVHQRGVLGERAQRRRRRQQQEGAAGQDPAAGGGRRGGPVVPQPPGRPQAQRVRGGP
jgi:hypothetical protein